MTYWLFVLICLIIHALVNFEIYRRKPTVVLPALSAYRVFVGSIYAYFVVDFLWGIFEENKLAIPLYVDTIIYFIVMGFTILAWARYVASYVDEKGWPGKALLVTGNLFFLAEIILLIINIFVPILFSVDMETCVYVSYKARNIMLYIQFLFYILLAIYSFVMAFKVDKKSLRARYGVIATYSIVMGTVIAVQVYYPYLPLYSVGCIVGCCLLNAFVINGIKEEYKVALEQSRVEVAQGQIELTETKHIAYSDPLTGVKNKHAYVEEEDRIDKLIAKGEMEDFAVVVFDLNGLKHVNDTKGHDAGDIYIVNSCLKIEEYFGEDNLYRFGGDEFVVILTGELYKNRSVILNKFEKYIVSCLNTDKPIISSGMSKYKRGVDNTYHAVFNRADKIMYARKDALKERTYNN